MPEPLTQALAELSHRLADDVHEVEITIRDRIWVTVYADYHYRVSGSAEIDRVAYPDLSAALAAAITTALARAEKETPHG